LATLPNTQQIDALGVLVALSFIDSFLLPEKKKVGPAVFDYKMG
jgi:hypothetical protein